MYLFKILYRVLLNNLALFQTNQYNIAKPKNPSERYYWSSINNVKAYLFLNLYFLHLFMVNHF